MATWIGPDTGIWTLEANWTGGVPNGVGATATFVQAAQLGMTRVGILGTPAIYLGTLDVTLSGTRGLTIEGTLDDGGGIGTLSFRAASGNAAVTVNSEVGGGEFRFLDYGGLQIELFNNTTFDIKNAGTSASIDAAMFGGGQLHKIGAGTLNLGSANTFTGGILLGGGTLSVESGNALGSGAIQIRNGATLRASGTIDNAIGTDATAVTLGGASAAITAPTGSALTLQGAFNHVGNGVFTFGSSGDTGTIFVNSSAFSHGPAGGFRIAGGTLVLGPLAAGQLLYYPGHRATEIQSGAVLVTPGYTNTWISNLDLNGGTIRAASGNLLLTILYSGGSIFSQSGTIEGTGSVFDEVVFSVTTSSFSLSGVTFVNFLPYANSIDLIGNDIANAITGSHARDVILGNGGNDNLTGGGGNDHIDGGEGNDVLNGGAGDDYMVGDLGDDYFVLADPGDVVVERAGEGIDTIATVFGSTSDPNARYVLPDNFENLELIGSGQGVSGNSAANVITDGISPDVILAGGGDDTVHARANDIALEGGAGFDKLVFSLSGTLSATVSGFEALELRSGASLSLSGAQFNAGLSATTVLSGTGTLTVNMAANTLLIGSAFSVAEGSSIALIANGTAGADYVKGVGYAGNTLYGNAGQDFLRGGQLADIILGGTERDKITGFGGADALYGGEGNDQFRYLFASDSAAGAGADHIADFLAGTDTLDFRNFDADPNTAAIDHPGFAFIDTQAFHATGAAEIRFAVAGPHLLVEADVDGDGVADLQIWLDNAGGQTLTGADFLI